ncbi:MAG: M56 family metallopeptidase [Winogradskyella sp.]|uniref:M56 family metallopeptidase n=1 Tax=Winogradskyella sp. TaxID=1883156 RepID=UPI00385AD795
MLYSILQIIAFQALFLLVYDLFLKRETFFNYNRAYLIVTAILSLVLPFIKFSELKIMATKDLVIHLPEVFIGEKTPTVYDVQIAEQAGIILEQPPTPIWQSIAMVGMAIATLIFLYKIVKLYSLKHKNPKRWQGNVLIVKLIKSSAAFSFFNTIFLGEQISEDEKPTIYQHELVHIKELHTIDLLFFELLRILFWFNPLVYMYQNRIKELHEYIADAKAVKQSGKADYYKSLLTQVLDVNHVSFTNTFFKKSLIKKRIAMLQKTKSKQLHLIKYGLLIPMVFGMLIYTSAEVRAQEKTDEIQELNQELTDAELIQKYYDEFVQMEKDGATFFEIMDYGGFNEESRSNYLDSKNDFFKSRALLNYISDMGIQRKSQNGTLTQYDIDSSEDMKNAGLKTYEDYLEWKKTKEAKDLWEASAGDGEIRLFIEDFGNMTNKEQNRYDLSVKQIETDANFNKLIVATPRSLMVLTDFKKSNSMNSLTISGSSQSTEVPFSVVDETPTTVDCKDLATNKERKDCMSAFVNKHIGKNFNTTLGDSLNPGKKRIFVAFKIDKEGYVKDIKARGPSVILEQEAKRVVATLPQFIPGKQDGKLVVVPFSIPIVFQVAGDAKTNNTKSYEELVAQRDRILKNSNDKNPAVVYLNQQIEALKKETMETVAKETHIEIIEEEIIEVTENSDEIPFSVIEVAPTHPDCNSFSEETKRKTCTSAAVNQLVGKNFNTNLPKTLGLPSGPKRILAQFIINKQGEITNVNARGPHPQLEEEIVRVLKLLPKFTPGKQKGKLVNVPFSLPIVFTIKGDKKE